MICLCLHCGLARRKARQGRRRDCFGNTHHSNDCVTELKCAQASRLGRLCGRDKVSEGSCSWDNILKKKRVDSSNSARLMQAPYHGPQPKRRGKGMKRGKRQVIISEQRRKQKKRSLNGPVVRALNLNLYRRWVARWKYALIPQNLLCCVRAI